MGSTIERKCLEVVMNSQVGPVVEGPVGLVNVSDLMLDVRNPRRTSRGCRQSNLVQIAMARIWQMAR